MSFKTLAAAVAVLGLTVGAASAQMQQQQQAPTARGGQNMAFCLQSAGGSTNCGFTTMASCDAAKQGQSDSCMRNPSSSTTGSGSMGGGSMSPNSGGMGTTAPGGMQTPNSSSR